MHLVASVCLSVCLCVQHRRRMKHKSIQIYHYQSKVFVCVCLWSVAVSTGCAIAIDHAFNIQCICSSVLTFSENFCCIMSASFRTEVLKTDVKVLVYPGNIWSGMHHPFKHFLLDNLHIWTHDTQMLMFVHSVQNLAMKIAEYPGYNHLNVFY